MEQKEFTNYVIPKIINEFPQFKDLCTSKSNDIIDIDYKSKNGKVTFWLTTQDKEIEVAIKFLKNLFSDNLNIIYSNLRGYFRVDNEYEVDEQEKGEIFETLKWTNL